MMLQRSESEKKNVEMDAGARKRNALTKYYGSGMDAGGIGIIPPTLSSN